MLFCVLFLGLLLGGVGVVKVDALVGPTKKPRSFDPHLGLSLSESAPLCAAFGLIFEAPRIEHHGGRVDRRTVCWTRSLGKSIGQQNTSLDIGRAFETRTAD